MPIIGTVQATGEFAPSATGDTYAILDAKYMRDGFRNVAILSDLDLITTDRRIAGMVVGVSGGTAYYKLNPEPWSNTFSDWSTFSTGGGGLTADTYFISGSSGTNSVKANNGTGLDATGNYSFAIGNGTLATGNTSYAEGLSTTASGNFSHAEGFFSVASGNFGAHAEGQSNAVGNGSHAEGSNTYANGSASHSEGLSTVANGAQSHSEGNATTAGGASAHAEGAGTIASGISSHAEGNGNIASGTASHAEGGFDGLGSLPNTASGHSSHAEGAGTTALGISAHAEGNTTQALGGNSHAEGSVTTAQGDSSHAEGSNTTASGFASHTQGDNTSALGTDSHASGINCVASGETSFVHGSGSTAGGNCTIVLGVNITGTTDNTVYVPDLNIQSTKAIKTSNGGVQINLDNGGNAGDFLMTTDSGGEGESGLFITPTQANIFVDGYNAGLFFGPSATEWWNQSPNIDNQKLEITVGNCRILYAKNITTGSTTGPNTAFPTAVVLNSDDSTFVSGVTNSVILGGTNISATTNNTAYVDNLNIKTIGSGTSVTNLGVDSNGHVVSASTGVAKYSTTLTTPSGTNIITHNLGTTDISVTLWLVTTGDMTSAQITNRTSNSVDVVFSSAPGENVRVVVLG